MDVQDGFIVGIYNYCDRWCETCRFTSRCRLFADKAEHEAQLDPALKTLVEAPPHPSDVHEPPPWLVELIEAMNKAAEAALSGGLTTEDLIAPLPDADAAVSRRAKEYAFRALEWLQSAEPHASLPADDPRSIIGWFSTLIASKTYRALSGLADHNYDPGEPRDCDGSAKIALIGIDRSVTAWQDLVSIALVADDAAASYVAELTGLKSELLARFPHAYSFIRPGFDEPDEVRRLEASGV